MRIYPENKSNSVLKIDSLNIQKCKCNCIVLDNDKKNSELPIEEQLCGCKMKVSLHEPFLIEKFHNKINTPDKWDRETCTIDDGKTNAYGDILFPGNENPSKYIRVSFKTNMDTILNLLFGSYWKLKKPELIISVTGGANKISLNERLKDAFSKGLVKAATTTNALVTTGGTFGGCMKLVGEAFKENALSIDLDQKVSVLGIASWCSLFNNKKLTRDSNTGPVEYELIKPRSEKKSLLDPNHSHFLLVDDAYNYFGGELKFRAELEAKIAEKFGIPIVVLVLGGGQNTAKSVLEAVQKQTPCVFLESSGEMEHGFSFAINRVKKLSQDENFDTQKLFSDVLFRRDVEEKLKKSFTSAHVQTITDVIQKTLTKEYLHLLTVCRSNKGNAELDVAILEALLNAKKKTGKEIDENANLEEFQTQLKLALKWNRIDIARNYIFTDDNRDKFGSLDALMYEAIIENKYNFVEIFLENGFSLKNFVTYRCLLNLYNDIPSTSLFSKQLEKQIRKTKIKKKASELIESKEKFNTNTNPINPNNKIEANHKGVNDMMTFDQIGTLIESLVDYIYDHKFTKAPLNGIDKENVYKILQDSVPGGRRKDKTIGIFALKEREIFDIDTKCIYPEHELFLFSILLCRYEMAKLFLVRGKNPICSALIATKILKSYATYLEDDKRAECDEMAKNFELMACDILMLAHQTDEINAQFTLIRKVPEFDNCTCMQIAIASDDLNFVAHPCFQNVIVRIWYYKILPDTSKLLLLVSLLCPFLAPFIIDFRDKQTEYETNNQNSNLQNKIIDEESPELENDFDLKSINLRQKNKFFDLGIQNKKYNYLEYIYHFLKSPFVKFFYHQIWYLIFMLLFSYVLLCDFYKLDDTRQDTSLGLAISIPEIILIIWVFTFLFDDIRKLFYYERQIFKAIIKNVGKNFWYKINLIAVSLYIIGMILRFIPNDDCYLAARIILSIDIIFWFLKSLNSYTFLRELGPKMYMIREMLKQLGYFLLIVVLFMFAFGVSSTSLMFKNQPLNKELLKSVFFPAYFVIGGEYYTRNIIMKASSSQCTEDDRYLYSECPDETGASVTLALYVIYLVFLNILLVNLLIAIFNNTYDQIEQEANKIWKSQRYALVYEYYHKSLFPPPFNLINYVFLLLRIIFRLCRKSYESTNKYKNAEKKKEYNLFRRFFGFMTKESTSGFVYEFDDPFKEDRIIRWEEAITDELINQNELKSKENFEFKIEKNYEKLDILTSRFEEYLENGNQKLNEKLETIDQSIKQLIAELESKKKI